MAERGVKVAHSTNLRGVTRQMVAGTRFGRYLQEFLDAQAIDLIAA
jgi:hypothetical protein